jgi:hypothetical protein
MGLPRVTNNDPDTIPISNVPKTQIDAVGAASIEASDCRYCIAIGHHSGSRTLTLPDLSFIRTDRSANSLTADRDRVSVNAAVSCQPFQQDRLARLCRHVTRLMGR